MSQGKSVFEWMCVLLRRVLQSSPIHRRNGFHFLYATPSEILSSTSSSCIITKQKYCIKMKKRRGAVVRVYSSQITAPILPIPGCNGGTSPMQCVICCLGPAHSLVVALVTHPSPTSKLKLSIFQPSSAPIHSMLQSASM